VSRKTLLICISLVFAVSLTVDGINGWKLRPFLNRREVESFTPEEKKVASLQSDLDGPLVDYAAKGTKVELQGPEKVEGKDTYKLKLAMKDEKVQHVWVARSSLDQQYSKEVVQMSGDAA